MRRVAYRVLYGNVPYPLVIAVTVILLLFVISEKKRQSMPPDVRASMDKYHEHMRTVPVQEQSIGGR